MLTQMIKYLDTIYVSGWQSSSTASSTDEPSPDLADYPMVCHPRYLYCMSLANARGLEHRPQQSQPIVHGPALP